MSIDDTQLSPPSNADFVERFRFWSEIRPHRVALRYLLDGDDREISWTFRHIDRHARAIAMRLIRHDLAGERVLLLFPPGLQFVTALFGCFYAGVVAVPAYPPRRNRNTSRIDTIAADAGAKAALTVSEVVERREFLIESTSALLKLQWIATDDVDVSTCDEWEYGGAADLAALQYTSGSTGKPKGVMLTQANIMHNCSMITQGFKAYQNTVGMSWLPMYHDMGLIGGVLTPLFIGCPTILMSPMAFLQKPFRWLKAITKYCVTISGGPNFAYDLCTKKITDEQIRELDLSTWEVAFNGAEPVRASTLDDFVERFSKCKFGTGAFYPCYGMAESTLFITGGPRTEAPIQRSFHGKELDARQVVPVERSADGARRLVSCGRGMLDQELRIVDPNSRQLVPADRVGEIWVSSPSVGKGYLGKPKATAETFQAVLSDEPSKSFLRTGDLGFVHEGELYVTGRLKDMIIVRGVNFYPQDIEISVERADECLRLGASAAFAAEDAGQERLIVVCEVERISKEDWSDVIATVRQSVAREHEIAPDAVVLVRTGSIPKTSSGKIQRHACRQGFLDNKLMTIQADYTYKCDRATKRSPRRHRKKPDTHARVIRIDEAQRSETSGHGGDDKIIDVVYAKIREVGRDRIEHLQPQTNVIHLGLDSLERVEIANRIAAHFKIQLSESVLSEIETCEQVANAVRNALGPVATHAARPEYSVEDFAEYRQLQVSKRILDQTNLPNPYFRVHESVARDLTQIDGQRLVHFCSYNYLGMSGDPIVTRAVAEATERFGSSVSASRVVSGERTLHRELEQEIAQFLRVDDALVMVGGHATNETTIGHLFGPQDLILHDSLAHNSIMQGAILSGAHRRAFPHNDWQELDRILSKSRSAYRRVLVVVEGVYSMDGDIAPIADFVNVKKKHQAWLMVDEAHSLGTIGATGRGVSEHFAVDPCDVEIWMGTLSKSLGSCGGYVAGNLKLIELMKYTAPGFVYSVGLSPPNAAAALASLRLLQREPQRVRTCAELSELFLSLARRHGLETGASNGTPVIPIIVGSSAAALALSTRLFSRGINVQPILYPAVEESAARLRFFITACHTEAQIRHAVDTVASEWGAMTSNNTCHWESAAMASQNAQRAT